jgi:uncharacterized repeat protein (TIGR03803 family)
VQGLLAATALVFGLLAEGSVPAFAGDVTMTGGNGANSAALPAVTFNNLVSFTGSNGMFPWNGPLVQGLDGDFYGTTNGGGIVSSSCGAFDSCGTVFKITPNGTLTTLYRFCSQINCTDGIAPYVGLVLATDGNFYGSTSGGGTHNSGTMFKITPAGKLTTIHDFCAPPLCTGADGGGPAGLVQGTDGNFYGTMGAGNTVRAQSLRSPQAVP